MSLILHDRLRPGSSSQYDYAYERWLSGQGLASAVTDPDVGRYKDKSYNSSEVELDDRTESFFLYSKVGI